MARWAIGDIQGCCTELEQLLARVHFSSDRDRLWLVGDVVNRGPQSLAALRLVRAMDANVVCVLGNHDLHLLAVALANEKLRKNDTLQEILEAPDRDALLEWLLLRPLAHHDPAYPHDVLLHAGLVPQWSLPLTLTLAGEVQSALWRDARGLLSHMYGDQPDRWRASLHGLERLRFTINVLTRLRFCTAEGRIDLKMKGRPESAPRPWMPWFEAPERASASLRIIFGHWSALGLHRARGLLGLDTGCVWGGALTGVNLDDPQAPPVSVPSLQPRSIEA
jgi:bis(5'-nucleosyl)-tetraphosphatase (symmetrical)